MSAEVQNINVTEDVTKLFNNLSVAKKELQNIRKELRRLGYCHQNGIEEVKNSLTAWKCESCTSKEKPEESPKALHCGGLPEMIPLQPIGVISSVFPEKRGVPRQPGICINTLGKITLFNKIFTNPDHALEGLNEFSHMWILFYFHKNDSTHVRAKVSPPRLNGLRVGVFGTRSPHRPSPIGLSLVQIDRVEGSSVYFSGVDMLDGTPVLDIKPYIPQYDNPTYLGHHEKSRTTQQDTGNVYASNDELSDRVSIPREAPDGEESISQDNSPPSTTVSTSVHQVGQVRVPQWISEPIVHQLTVTFKEKAQLYLDTLKGEGNGVQLDEKDSGTDVQNSIIRILEEDPRSVYVRERYGNQFYTFLIGNHHVSCKFNDSNHSVQVFKITKASPFEEWKGSFDNSDNEN